MGWVILTSPWVVGTPGRSHKMQYLPALESAVGFVEKTVPYIYTAAAVAGARQVYQDRGTLAMPTRTRRTYGSSSRRVRRRTGTYAPRQLFRSAPTAAPTAVGIHSKTRHSRYHTTLGRRPGKYSSRRHMREFSRIDGSALGNKKLFSERLVSIPYSDNDTLINCRKGQLCNVRGVKLNMWFRMRPDEINNPLQVRWAILSPKEQTGNALNAAPQDFFINPDPANEMSKDWQATGNAFKYMNRKINREQFGVVKEGTFILSSVGAPDVTVFSPKAFKKIKMYIPIARQMKFDQNAFTDEAQYPNSNLYFCVWYCDLADRTTAADAALNLDWFGELTTYFHNSDMYK